MSTSVELILNKVTNENIEINCRAMTNLLTKISNNLISLETLDDITGYKFLFSLSKWLSIFLGNYQQYKYDPPLIISVLNLYLKCLDVFPPSATQNLKKDFKISSLINDIGSINLELSNICDQIQHSLSRNAIELITGKNSQRNLNSNLSNTPEKEFYSYGNTFNNNFYESSGNYNINNTNNFFNYTQPNGFRNNMNIKISNTNNTVNFNNNNNINSNNNKIISNNNVSFQEANSLINNSNSNILNNINENIPMINYENNFNTISSNQTQINNNNKNIKSSSLVNPSLIILHENIGDYPKISKEDMINFNSQQKQSININKNKNELEPTFNKIVIPQQEEQFIFDIGISLKYGDSVQIYHSFNIFYTQILNDIPIEYLFFCDEIIKSICSIMEKCDFLEFGVLCYKIIDKIISLIQKKISLELNNLNNLYQLSNSTNENNNNILIINQDTSKIENFVYYILTSLLISMNNNITKLAFYIPLCEKCFNLMNQLIIGYNNYYEILYKILFNFDKIISNYKMKNIDIPNFFIFILKIYINLDDNILVDLIENSDDDINVIEFIKNIFFTVYNNENNLVHTLCLNLLNKFENLKEDSNKINNFLIDYNNANLISKSIQMTQEMLNGNFDLNSIIDNFYNVLLTLKYLNNSPNNNNDYNVLFSNNSSPLIKALCDYYVENPEKNFEKTVDLIIKLLSFKAGDKTEISAAIYNSILDELKIKGNIIHRLFYNNKILNIFFNDLANNDNLNKKILDILFTLFNDLDENENQNNLNQNNYHILKQFFLILPSFPKNFRFSSLQNKLESSLSYEEIYFKYLRNLFSKNSNIRKNAINFFKNNSKEEMDLNADNLENENDKMDTIYCIQTGESEMLKTLKTINDETNIAISNTNEFLPLLNILMSNKIDTNMKSSSLSQLILMIKNKNYKNYYLNDILTYIIKELEIDIKKYDITTLGNYYYQLIKLLCVIVFIYLKEDKIQNLLNPKNNTYQLLINNLISIALKDDTSHHLLSSFALIFINIYAFYYRNNNLENKNILSQNNKNEFNEALPVLKFFSNYYFINMVPTDYIENILSENDNDTFNINNSILNFSVTKNIIDFMNYLKNPLNKLYEINQLKNEIKNLRGNDLLNVLNIITKFFEFNSIYYSEDFDFNEELLNINLFFKRIIPNSTENKNIIMDFINILEIALSSDISGKLLSNYTNIFFPFIPDFLMKIFHYISIEKEFINTLESNIENQNFVYELLHFICLNPSFFPFNNKDDLCIKILSKFLETYHNIFIFNSQSNFYRIKIGLIKFENIFFNEILELNLDNKAFSDKLNSLIFFLSKYEPNITFNSYNYLLWSLKYITQLIKAKKSVDVIESKSYIFSKLLQSPFIEIKICALNILKNLFSKNLFSKHGTILYDIYNAIKKVQNKILRINYFNFLIKSFEFILQQKNIDETNDQFCNEILTMNAEIIAQSELINILNQILSEKNYDSMYSAMVLKYLNICLNINLEDDSYAKGIFFGFSFIDLFNDIISREIDILKKVIILDNENDPYMKAKPFGYFCYYDNNKKDKECLNITLQSILNIKEGLNLLIRSLSLLNEEFYLKYKTNITEVMINLINYGELVSKSWDKWKLKNDINHIKILQAYVIKFFSSVYFIYTSNLMNSGEIFPINSNKRLNNICYDFMKFDSQQNIYEPTIKIMFTKLLPFLLKMDDKNKQNNKKNNINSIYGDKKDKKVLEAQLKNDGDTLLEVMNVIKKIYNIKFEVYGENMKSNFQITEDNTDIKNDLMNSLGSLLLQNQNCKKIFVRSKFINTFIDYLYQLQSFLLNDNINNQDKRHNNNILNKTLNASMEQNNSYFEGTKNSKMNESASNRFSNSRLNKNSNSINSNSINNYIIEEFQKVLQLFQNLMYNFDKCEERKLLFISGNNNTKDDKKNFLVLLYNIFYDTLKHNILFENYLKLMLNIISNSNGDLTNYLILNLKSTKNDNLIELILSHFVSSINYMSSNPNFDLYIKFLTCLFQYSPIANKVLKLKFDENVKSILIDLLQQRRVYENKNLVKLIGNLIKLFMSLSLNEQHARKLGNKEFLILLSEFIQNTKNENVIYYILFFFRNISFVSSCKNIFVKNENLIKIIFDMFIDENKKEYIQEIKNLNIHLQKEYDMIKYNKQYGNNLINNESESKLREDEFEKNYEIINKYNEDNTENKKEKDYFENTCLNLRKILHILEI